MLKRIEHDAVLELRLDRPPVNALDPGLIKALDEAVTTAPAEGARALIISGSPGMFSAGLDVPALLALDETSLRAFWTDFFGLMEHLAGSPIPIAAAITGHSPAGGAVMALFCDTRIMAEGDYRIGLNEVQVGLPVPGPIVFALKRLLGPRVAEPLLVTGALLEPDDALHAGLVDAVVPGDQVIDSALEWCRQRLALPPRAMSMTRQNARSDLVSHLRDSGDKTVEELTTVWYSDETQSTLKALVEHLKNK